ncbi:MAG: selenide, water dikinase SelD [Bryobacteraceae bacterium]|nr:selenide, water dikinase SelD [Bryobacteraceae bacterium]
MDQVLRKIPRVANPDLLVGFETSDDAGVYRLSPECALVQTVDFFTPIVDDPFLYGAIAAANALSDVYAMGGKPLTALSILCYPASGDLDVLGEILKGGAGKIHESGCVIVGGHSVADDEIKFGYAVTGLVSPDKIWTNAGARPGDILILSKAIGTGVISTALKRGIAREADVEESIESMLRLNRDAAAALAEAEVHAATDITGFGLIGHAREIANASDVTIELNSEWIPLLRGAREYARAGAIPGGLKNNREFASPAVEGAADLDGLLYDPQTSGGLLAALPEGDADAVLRRMEGARVVGRVTQPGEKRIRLL